MILDIFPSNQSYQFLWLKQKQKQKVYSIFIDIAWACTDL